MTVIARFPQTDARDYAVQTCFRHGAAQPINDVDGRGLEQRDSCEPLDPLPSNTGILCGDYAAFGGRSSGSTTTLIAVQDGRIGAKAFDPCSGAHTGGPD